jgi:hypothetical protein
MRAPLALVTAIAAATNAAFIFGLLTMLSWQESLMVIVTAGARAGGAVFGGPPRHRVLRWPARRLPDGIDSTSGPRRRVTISITRAK